MNIIAAVDERWGIGKDGKLLVKLPEDLRHFKEITKGKIVVMGRKTYESLPKHLEGRMNIVLSSNPEYTSDRGRIEVCTSIKDLLRFLEHVFDTTNYTSKDVFIIGGGTVYERLLDLCERAYITSINSTFPADTYFPNLRKNSNWKLMCVDGFTYSRSGHTFSYHEYKNLNVQDNVIL